MTGTLAWLMIDCVDVPARYDYSYTEDDASVIDPSIAQGVSTEFACTAPSPLPTIQS